MSGPLSLSATGLVRRLGRFVLNVAEVHVPAGEALAVLGPSGSGKTTLLHLLGLLQRPDQGQVFLDDKPVRYGDRQAQLQMAAVFQRPYLFKGSVADNVAYGLAFRPGTQADKRTRVNAALTRVGLEGYAERGSASLSGGEAQRVSLARALVLEPRVLLLDEPLASLDPMLKRKLTHDFGTILREAGVTVVYVTHDQDEALSVGDHIAVMNAGKMVALGPAEEMMGLPTDTWTAEFLGLEQPLVGNVESVAEGAANVSVHGTTLTVGGEPSMGATVDVAVRPEDVLLFEGDADLPMTTARNRLRMRVEAMETRGTTLRVALVDDNGVRIASSVSRASARELGLTIGSETLAVFKATAVRWRYR